MRETPRLQVRCKAPIGTLNIDICFTLTAGWTVLFGPSGSGKSSLLRLIAGLWRPADSRVLLGSESLTDYPPHLRRVGFVAQDPLLFPHLDVFANVRFGCARGAPDTADAMLDLFDLRDLRRRRIRSLSGGEQQRVALARAFAAEPRVLLLDEVFTGMHLRQRERLLQRIHEHCTARSVPVLSVTHDAVEAGLIDGEILRLQGGQIVARGRAAEVLADERLVLLRALERR